MTGKGICEAARLGGLWAQLCRHPLGVGGREGLEGLEGLGSRRWRQVWCGGLALSAGASGAPLTNHSQDPVVPLDGQHGPWAQKGALGGPDLQGLGGELP